MTLVHEPPVLPSIMEVMAGAGRKGATVAVKLDEMFEGSIAPLVLLSTESFASIDGFGPKTTLMVKRQLRNHGLAFREFGLPVERKAIEVYHSIDRLPVQALFVYRAISNGEHYAHYMPGRVIHIFSQHGGGMNLRQLVDLSQEEAIEIIERALAMSTNAGHAKDMLEELERRLGSWQLQLLGSLTARGVASHIFVG